MSTTATHDLCIKSGEYTDRNGETKGRWLNIGTVFRHDDGGTSIKLTALPIGVPDWQGWVSVFKREPKEDGRQGQQGFQAPDQGNRYPNSAASGTRGGYRHQPPQQAAPPVADFDDDIPF